MTKAKAKAKAKAEPAWQASPAVDALLKKQAQLKEQRIAIETVIDTAIACWLKRYPGAERVAAEVLDGRRERLARLSYAREQEERRQGTAGRGSKG